MAQQYMTDSGVVLTDPGTYVSPQVIANQGGIPTVGVVTVVGEADEGPDFSQESDLNDNGFAPDSINQVLTKYGSGRLVDAFRLLASSAADDAIVGSVSLIKLVKTNKSLAAAALLERSGFGTYASLVARRQGLPGNLIKYKSEVYAGETPPSTGLFAYVPHYEATPFAFSLRTNGSAAKSVSIAAVTAPDTLASALDDQAFGILAQGGSKSQPLAGKATLAISASTTAVPEQLVVTIAGPVIGLSQGMTIVIPRNGDFGVTHDSAILGALGGNAGSYILQSVTSGVSSSTITMLRMNHPSGASLEAVSSVVHADEDDLLAYQPLSLSNATGMDRQSLVGLSGLFTVVSVVGPQAVLSLPADWSAMPKQGDLCSVPADFAGLLRGFYLVVSVTSSGMVIHRLSAGSAGAPGSDTVALPITQATQPFFMLKPVIDGLGKSMEVIGDVSDLFKNKDTLAPVTFSDSLLLSSSEYRNMFTVSRDTIAEPFVSGGDIVLRVGSTISDAKVVIGASDIQFLSGSTALFTASFKQFLTLQDLASFISSQTSWSASVVSTKFSFLSPSLLDRGTFSVASSDLDFQPGRFKTDAHSWRSNVSGSGLLTASTPGFSGLPELVFPDQFLSGGAKGGSTSADFVAAIDALEMVETNFVVPLVSKDAAEDIAEGETESTSTYTADAIHAYCKSHVLAMSSLLSRKNRLALVGRSGSYESQKEAAGSLSSYRVGMTFQDIKAVASSGLVEQYQPWATACIAAGMQSSAGYKGIVKKFANVLGILKPEGDFNPIRYSDRVDALKAGLMPLERVPTGGFRWISDQLTYSIDNNFVYNSLQAVYIADLMILSMIADFDRAMVGKSVAEISAAGALSYLDGLMFNFKRLRWIAASDDAPKGYKNASVRIRGGVMEINLEVKLAGLLYFIPINFAISQVVQEASQ